MKRKPFRRLNEGTFARRLSTPTFARIKVERAINAKDERIMRELDSYFKTQKPGFSGIFYSNLKEHGIVCPQLDAFVTYLMGKGFNIDALSSLEEKAYPHDVQTVDYDLSVGDLVSTYNRSGVKIKGEVVSKKSNGEVSVRYREGGRNIVINRDEADVYPIDDVELADFAGYNTYESFSSPLIATFLSKYHLGDTLDIKHDEGYTTATIIDTYPNMGEGYGNVKPIFLMRGDDGKQYELTVDVKNKEWFIEKA